MIHICLPSHLPTFPPSHLPTYPKQPHLVELSNRGRWEYYTNLILSFAEVHLILKPELIRVGWYENMYIYPQLFGLLLSVSHIYMYELVFD